MEADWREVACRRRGGELGAGARMVAAHFGPALKGWRRDIPDFRWIAAVTGRAVPAAMHCGPAGARSYCEAGGPGPVQRRGHGVPGAGDERQTAHLRSMRAGAR